MIIRLKRAYAAPDDADGFRVLVDRLWPRGVGKAQLRLAAWLPELAPTDGLRRWFNHEPSRWPEFKERYFEELSGRQAQIGHLVDQARKGPVTLIYAAKNERHNNAVALLEFLETFMSSCPAAADKEEASPS